MNDHLVVSGAREFQERNWIWLRTKREGAEPKGCRVSRFYHLQNGGFICGVVNVGGGGVCGVVTVGGGLDMWCCYCLSVCLSAFVVCLSCLSPSLYLDILMITDAYLERIFILRLNLYIRTTNSCPQRCQTLNVKSLCLYFSPVFRQSFLYNLSLSRSDVTWKCTFHHHRRFFNHRHGGVTPDPTNQAN